MAIGSDKFNSNFSLVDYIRFRLGDKDKVLFSDDELRLVIEDHFCPCTSTRTTKTPTGDSDSLVYRDCCKEPVYLTKVFDGSTDVTDNSGVFVTEGPSLKITFDTAPTGTVTATVFTVDFPLIMRDLYLALAEKAAQDPQFQSFGDITLNDAATADNLRKKAYDWQGTRQIDTRRTNGF